MTGQGKSFVRTLLLRSIGSHVILAGPLRGYRIVISWHDLPGRHHRSHGTLIAGLVRPERQTRRDLAGHRRILWVHRDRIESPGGRGGQGV